MKLYVITEGCYSDYGIVCIFRDRKKAQNYLRFHKTEWNDMRIESYTLQDDSYEICDVGYYMFEASCVIGRDKIKDIFVEYQSLSTTESDEYTNLYTDYEDSWELSICRVVKEDSCTKAQAKEKVKKMLIDLANQILYYKHSNYSYMDIRKLLGINNDTFTE